MEEKEIATKRCSKCGRELLVTEFAASKKSKDGLDFQCRECTRAYQREWNKKRRLKKKAEESKFSPEAAFDNNFSQLHQVFNNPELAKLTPRDLILELRARGYSGELSYTMKVKI